MIKRFFFVSRHLFLIIILTTEITGCAFEQDKSDWFGADKFKHFTVSTAMSAGFTHLAEKNQPDCLALATGTSLSISVGLGKEWYDRDVRKTYWSQKDFFWDVMGSLFGSSLVTHCY